MNEILEAENLKATVDDRFTLYFIRLANSFIKSYAKIISFCNFHINRRSIETEISELAKDSNNGEFSE